MASASAYISLAVAIAFEVVGTSFLQQSQQFSRLWPSIGVVVCYTAAFYFLAMALKTFPVGVAYAMWSGLGIVLISAIGVFVFRQSLDLAAIIGLGLIIAGVIVVNVFSKSVTH